MVRVNLDIKTCCLYVIRKKRSNLSKNFLHPQKYALPYTYGCNTNFLWWMSYRNKKKQARSNKASFFPLSAPVMWPSWLTTSNHCRLMVSGVGVLLWKKDNLEAVTNEIACNIPATETILQNLQKNLLFSSRRLYTSHYSLIFKSAFPPGRVAGSSGLRVKGARGNAEKGAFWWRHHTQPTVVRPFDQA